MDIVTNDRTYADEDGVALVYALLVVLVVGAVVAVMMATSLSEQRLALAELQFEDTVHVAEAGAEDLLDDVDASTDFSNTPAPSCWISPGGCTQAELREWAVTEAEAKGSDDLVALSEGESVGLRHDGSNYVYGVGFVPSREAVLDGVSRSYVRVVRMRVDYDDPEVRGDFTFLADTLLNVNGGGGSTVRGGVKSNVDIDPPRDGWDVDVVEVVGDCDPSTDEDPAPCPEHYTQVLNKTPIPFGTARELYDSDTSVDLVTDPEVPWYDYCDGTTWRERESPFVDPCSGAEASDTGFNGTSLDGTADGVYYFDGGEDVTLTGGPHTMTIITRGTVNLPGGGAVMNWTPAYPGLLVYSGDVIGASGTPDYLASSPGIVYAQNNITISGNANSTDVSWMAGGTFRLDGGGSGTETGGTFRLTAPVEGVDPGTPPTAVVAEWGELN